MASSTENISEETLPRQKIISFSTPVGQAFLDLKEKRAILKLERVTSDNVLVDLLKIAEKFGYPTKDP